MTTLWTLGLCSLITLSDGDPAERLKEICESLANAPSATFELNLLPLGKVEKRKTDDGKEFEVGAGTQPQRLVIQRERGKPEHLRLDDAELFRFEGGPMIGRLGSAPWAVVTPPKDDGGVIPMPRSIDDGSTALERLASAAQKVPFPAALMEQLKGEIKVAEAKEKNGSTRLVAYLNGHEPVDTLDLDELEKRPERRDGEENTQVTATVRADGTVASIVVGR